MTYVILNTICILWNISKGLQNINQKPQITVKYQPGND